MLCGATAIRCIIMSGFLRGVLHRPMLSFRKWKDLCHAVVERCEGRGGVLCDHSCTYLCDPYI